MMDQINVLIVYPNPQCKIQIESLPQDVVKNYRFIFQDQSCSSLQQYLEDAKKIVSQEKIKIVLSNGDIGALVKAALVQEFPHLRGPSVESVLLAYNKYYTRCFLDPQPIPFASLDLTTPNLDQACEEALEKVGTPAFFKPSTSYGSKGISSISDIQQLKHYVRSYIRSDNFTLECSDAKFMNPFYAKNSDENKYPLYCKPTGIVEKHMGDDAVVTNSDSYVFNGEIYHWSMADNLYSKIKPGYYMGAFVPTTLPECTQQKIWNVHDAVVEKMIKLGFDNEFVNVETFLLNSGEVKLVEVNPRRGGNLYLSKDVLRKGNVIGAQLKLAQGENPGTPVPIDGRCAFKGFIRTSGCGKVKEFYDYSFTDPALLPEPGLHPDDMIDGRGESGVRVAQTFLTGDSYEEVIEKYWSICRQVLLKPELSIWK